METQTIVRQGLLRGKGIKKRCRKVENVFIRSRGETDEEAIENMRLEVEKANEKYRELHLSDKFIVYDVKVDHWNGYKTFEEPIFPSESDNIINVNL